MGTRSYDALIVGSGATGALAAAELTRRGVGVLLLEAGPPPVLPAHVEERGPAVQNMEEWNSFWKLFLDRSEHPYTTLPGELFEWRRARYIGGRLNVWGRRALRMGPSDFKAASIDGVGEDWPLSYEELAPYYAYVERLMGVTGSREQLPQIPDGEFLPPSPLSSAEEHLGRSVTRRWPNRKVIPHRLMVRGAPHLLELARSTGRLELRSDAVVRQVLVDADTGRASGVEYLDRHTKQEHLARAKVVILAASTLETCRLLLNSKSPQHPAGLANSSGLVGCHLMDHLYADGIAEGMLRGVPQEKRNLLQGFLVPSFRNITEPVSTFVRSYAFMGFAGRGQTAGEDSRVRVLCFGEVLPRKENRVVIDPGITDPWGIPSVRIELSYGDNERAMVRDMHETISEMLKEAGAEEIILKDLDPPGTSAHELGGARMGRDPRNSVLDPFNQAWDVDNLFVIDGACFVSVGWQNPTLTMMALAARACDRIIQRLRSRDL